MTTKTKKSNFMTFKQTSDKIKDIVEKLKSEIIREKNTDKFKSYLNFLSKQTVYSVNNTILI